MPFTTTLAACVMAAFSVSALLAQDTPRTYCYSDADCAQKKRQLPNCDARTSAPAKQAMLNAAQALGVDQLATAACWLRIAAAQDDATAQGTLAIILYTGPTGVPANPKEALGFAIKAANAHNYLGDTCLSLMYANGTVLDKDQAKSDFWEQVAERDKAASIKTKEDPAPKQTPPQASFYYPPPDDGSSPAEVAARFGVSEIAVRQRLKLARVSPTVFEAYRQGSLNLEQVQAFAVTDDSQAQERVFSEMAGRNVNPTAIRRALTEGEIRATDKRAQFVTVEAYEEAGGAVRRDLFAEDDEGIFILDSALLARLTLEKLEAAAAAVRAEGWKWVEARLEFGYEEQTQFRSRQPEPLPLSDEAAAEQKRLAEEYQTLFETGSEEDEARSDRLDEIEARIEELEATEEAYTPDVFTIAGAVVSIDSDGELEVTRGLVKPEDEPEREASGSEESAAKEKPPFSASLVESLTSCRSLAVSASLLRQPNVALAAVVHSLVTDMFRAHGEKSVLQLSVKLPRLRESCKGKEELEAASEGWRERLPKEPGQLWGWCIAQDQDTLLELLAFCAALALDGVQRKGDRSDSPRLSHASALAASLSLDMKQWFTPTKENYFSRVSRPDIAAAITEAKSIPAKRSWDKLKKSELATVAEQEVAGTSWLPVPLRVAA